MKTETLPLKVLSINELYNGDKATYEVPIYQRNYAWKKEEIYALIHDVYDVFEKATTSNNTNDVKYYIGTLVSFNKGDQVFEIIDGQQRLTTIHLILKVLELNVQNNLTYRARKKSTDTLDNIPDFNNDEKDTGIVSGYEFAKLAIDEIVHKSKREKYKDFFLYNVCLVHYQVPKDINLNHYFEVMNSRGEQLEKHEIIKARLINKLERDEDRALFNHLWECCSEMNVYIQQKYRDTTIFGSNLDSFDYNLLSFDDLLKCSQKFVESKSDKSISELIKSAETDDSQDNNDKNDTFQPIIDFSNFLLIVLKITRMEEGDFDPERFILDDKELINEFENVEKAKRLDTKFVKRFGYNLLLAKYLLDNYMVHHSNESDTIENNPWKLEYWHYDGKTGYLKNLEEDTNVQRKLVHLLSMFEVTFTARQRKNYLFYCLLYLITTDSWCANEYCDFVSSLADKYFYDVYLVPENLNEINTPIPGSFDKTILTENNELDTKIRNDTYDFSSIYGDGTEVTAGIPLFVFNYLDYRLWDKYATELRGRRAKEGGSVRNAFFLDLGCNDFELDVFNHFYFSRTRRSLEHYYAQSLVNKGKAKLSENEINCFGNFAMIGGDANSAGSNWTPKAKLNYYLDDSGKIKLVSVSSLKFRIMMQICKDNQTSRESGLEWIFDDIIEHQKKMLDILEVF